MLRKIIKLQKWCRKVGIRENFLSWKDNQKKNRNGLPLFNKNSTRLDHTLSFVYMSAPLTCCVVRARRVSGMWLINFPRTWGEQRTPDAWRHIQISLCLGKKLTNFDLWRMVCEPFADSAAQVCSPVHTHEHLVRDLFASGSQIIQHACVYEALCDVLISQTTATTTESLPVVTDCFLCVRAFKWIYLPFRYIIIFQTWQSTLPPSSTPKGDKHRHPLTFL